MTRKDKELLLKDLCGRLPYGIKIELTWWVMGEGTCINTTLEPDHIEQLLNDEDGDTEIKPYLRPMSSMTKDEKEELVDFGLAYWDNGKYTDEDGYTIIYGGKEFQLLPDIETYDWLDKHHFDYRGLIEKGLALETPEGMYN